MNYGNGNYFDDYYDISSYFDKAREAAEFRLKRLADKVNVLRADEAYTSLPLEWAVRLMVVSGALAARDSELGRVVEIVRESEKVAA